MAEYLAARRTAPPKTPAKQAKIRGLIVYSTGKACKNGHICERYVNNNGCVQCVREKVARFLAKNPGYEKLKHQKRAERERAARAARPPKKCAAHGCTNFIPPDSHKRKFCGRGCMHRSRYREMRLSHLTLKQQEQTQ
jgi:hypothetical protein